MDVEVSLHDNILPCPFCGQLPELLVSYFYGCSKPLFFKIKCRNNSNDCVTPKIIEAYDKKEIAIQKWNTRKV